MVFLHDGIQQSGKVSIELGNKIIDVQNRNIVGKITHITPYDTLEKTIEWNINHGSIRV